MSIKFEVTLDLLEEMAECVVTCGLSVDEAYDYMKACVTGEPLDEDHYEQDDKHNTIIDINVRANNEN